MARPQFENYFLHVVTISLKHKIIEHDNSNFNENKTKMYLFMHTNVNRKVIQYNPEYISLHEIKVEW